MWSVSDSEPIWFTLMRMALAAPFGDAPLEDLLVGDEQIVTDNLDAGAVLLGELLPAIPVALVETVLDRHEREGSDQLAEVVDHLRGRQRAIFALQGVGAVGVELVGGDVEGERDILSRRVAGRLDCLGEQLEGFAVGGQVGGETALVADVGGQAALAQHSLERVIDLNSPPQSLGEAGSAGRDEHELLDVHRVGGMGATVENVHHRNRQHPSGRTAQVLEERDVEGGGRRPGRRQRDAEDGVGPEVGLVGGGVEVDHDLIERFLIDGIHADDGRARSSR